MALEFPWNDELDYRGIETFHKSAMGRITDVKIRFDSFVVIMNLTPEQLVDNWKQLINIIETNFSGNRKTNLLRLYNHFEERISLSPASGKDYYHGAYPGGYVAHVLNITDIAIKLDKMWVDLGAVRDYDYESLIFVALNHDLGKIGDMEHEYYVTHNQKWRKERGELYIINDDLRYMSVPDRSLWLSRNPATS